MARYKLPNIEKSDDPGNKSTKAKPVWQRQDLDAWLRSPKLADWVEGFVSGLAEKYRDALPALFGSGLGEDHKIPAWMHRGRQEPHWVRGFLSDRCLDLDIADLWFDHHFLQDDPAWLKQLLHYEKAKVARSYLLTGNIADYSFDPVYGYRPTIRLLVDSLLETKECVITYRLSQRVRIYSRDEDIEKRLPESIVSAVGRQNNETLAGSIGYLFDKIGAWLSGKPDNTTDDFPGGVAFIFENLHLLISGNRDDMERNYLVDHLLHWSSSPALFRSSHCLILMAEELEDVGNELRSRGGKIEQITIPRPNSDDARLKFLLPN